MKIIFFSKYLKDHTVDQLAEAGAQLGTEGWDLCVRPGYAVNPGNVETELPVAARKLAAASQPVLMVSGSLDLLWPDQPGTDALLRGMDAANVRVIKLGYFRFNPATQNYWQEVERIRQGLAGWEVLARRYNVKVVYHTHSGMGYMGTNCAALMHLLKGFDPQFIGAYLDPGHMRVNGEPFAFGLAMAKDYLAMIGLKDVHPRVIRNAEADEGAVEWDFVPAGQGGVAWSEVFASLAAVGFNGPCSVHAEFEMPRHAPHLFLPLAQADVSYFKLKRDAALRR